MFHDLGKAGRVVVPPFGTHSSFFAPYPARKRWAKLFRPWGLDSGNYSNCLRKVASCC